jgi:hypothetical protein
VAALQRTLCRTQFKKRELCVAWGAATGAGRCARVQTRREVQVVVR